MIYECSIFLAKLSLSALLQWGKQFLMLNRLWLALASHSIDNLGQQRGARSASLWLAARALGHGASEDSPFPSECLDKSLAQTANEGMKGLCTT